MDIPDLPMLIQSFELKPLMMSVDSSGDGGVVERQNLEGNKRCGVGVAERVVLLHGQNVHGRRTDEERSLVNILLIFIPYREKRGHL
jgi:hypothetical protein